MTTSSPRDLEVADPAVSDPARSWSGRQVRTSRYIAALGLILAVAALWACGQPWIAVSLSGQPACDSTVVTTLTTVTASGQPGQVNVPAICSTGWQLQAAAADTGLAEVIRTQYGPSVSLPSPFPTTWGVPSIALWTALAGLALLAGALLRNALIIAAAVIPWQLGQAAFAGTSRNMTSGLDPSQFTLESGWTILTVTGPVLLVVAVVSVVFVARTNHRIRRAASGGRPPMTGALADVLAVVARHAVSASPSKGDT